MRTLIWVVFPNWYRGQKSPIWRMSQTIMHFYPRPRRETWSRWNERKLWLSACAAPNLHWERLQENAITHNPDRRPLHASCHSCFARFVYTWLHVFLFGFQFPGPLLHCPRQHGSQLALILQSSSHTSFLSFSSLPLCLFERVSPSFSLAFSLSLSFILALPILKKIEASPALLDLES